MADTDEQDQLAASTFPPPPFWYKLYGDSTEGPPPGPPPPIEGSFQVFEKEFNTEEPLVSTTPNNMIHRRNDGSIDVKGQILSISCELLPLFLELIRALVENPSASSNQLSAVSSSLDALQHLSNMLRPQQAAACLEHALRLDVEEQQNALSCLRTQIENIDQMLVKSADEISNTCAEPGASMDCTRNANISVELNEMDSDKAAAPQDSPQEETI